MSNSTKPYSQNRNHSSVKKYIRFENELLAAIENHRSGTGSFSSWVKSACREKLDLKSSIDLESDENIVADTEQLQPDRALVMQMHASGLFNQQIADILNEKGIKPLNGAKLWTRAGVSKFLK